ncbi:plasmid partition protein ParG [Serratia liquefaciens]|uniref:plasmid partition protein ParG n=1 Tax=Serratia liquefaciens TaxID=614 RepID=UPI0022B9DDCA|nr:plasmid partition protein ParG [Serratia liquefaciens]
MSGKKVTFGAKPTKLASSADAWVESRSIEEAPPQPVEKMKRLTIDIPESLHKAIKSACALRGTKIADEVRELLYKKYGKE